MRSLEKIKKLRRLLKKPIFTAAEARSVGVHPSLLAYYVKQGFIERVERGIYRGVDSEMNVDFQFEDLILAVKRVPEGVVCLVSALAIYEMTEEIPRLHWIAIPNSSRAPKRKGVKIVRMRNISLGKTEITIGDQIIQIFDRERTVLDAFRYLGKETAIKSLKLGLIQKGDQKIQIVKLQEYAKKMRVDITSYILAVTT